MFAVKLKLIYCSNINTNIIMSHLSICILNEKLIKSYKNIIKNFNESLDERHRDSGFDLFVPECTNINTGKTISIDHCVICAVHDSAGNPLPYYMFPRSSISKTPLRLANSVGIIDSGYRGTLIAKVDILI